MFGQVRLRHSRWQNSSNMRALPAESRSDKKELDALYHADPPWRSLRRTPETRTSMQVPPRELQEHRKQSPWSRIPTSMNIVRNTCFQRGPAESHFSACP